VGKDFTDEYAVIFLGDFGLLKLVVKWRNEARPGNVVG